jgi:hypothetical protein
MSNGNINAPTELEAIAAEALAALDACHQISPFSARLSAFDLDDAYRVTAAIRRMRERRGEMPVGRKIGFTNRTAWPEYGPMWGYVYNRTVHKLAEIGDTFSLEGLAEPRIEPEIIFKLASAPAPGMDETALLGCIDWVGHGFEIVQSIFGDVPTKVRKTPRDSAQTRIYTTRRGFLRLPKSDCFQAANFGGLIPTESWSFSSEKSYSPSRLICCQDTTEPFAMAWNRISRASGPMTSLIFWDK